MTEVLVKSEYYRENSEHASIFSNNIQKKLKTFCRKIFKHGFNARNTDGKLPEFLYVIEMPITHKRIGFLVTVHSSKTAVVHVLSTDDMRYQYVEDYDFVNNIMDNLVCEEKMVDIDEEVENRCGIDYSFTMNSIESVDGFIKRFTDKIKNAVREVRNLLDDEHSNFVEMCKELNIGLYPCDENYEED